MERPNVTWKDYVDTRWVELHRYIDQRFIDIKEERDARFAAVTKAVEVANDASDRRFESVNEFRAQLGDQTRTLMPRPEYEANHRALSDRIDQLATRLLRQEAQRRGNSEVWGWIVGGLGVIGLIISMVYYLMQLVRPH